MNDEGPLDYIIRIFQEFADVLDGFFPKEGGEMAKKSKKDIVLFAVASNDYYNEEIGYVQPLLFLTYKKAWDKGECSDYFTDFVHSALDAFGLEEHVEGVFAPSEDTGPMNSLDLAEAARSMGFVHDEGFEAKAKEFRLD